MIKSYLETPLELRSQDCATTSDSEPTQWYSATILAQRLLCTSSDLETNLAQLLQLGGFSLESCPTITRCGLCVRGNHVCAYLSTPSSSFRNSVPKYEFQNTTKYHLYSLHFRNMSSTLQLSSFTFNLIASKFQFQNTTGKLQNKTAQFQDKMLTVAQVLKNPGR